MTIPAPTPFTGAPEMTYLVYRAYANKAHLGAQTWGMRVACGRCVDRSQFVGHDLAEVTCTRCRATTAYRRALVSQQAQEATP